MSKQYFDKLNTKITDYLTDISTLSDNLKKVEAENAMLKKDVKNYQSKAENALSESKELKKEIEDLKKELEKRKK